MSVNQELPKISIIIALYQNQQYINDAIQSALAQDYPNIDVFVIDDASPEKFDIFNQSPNANWIRTIFPVREEEIEYGQTHTINGRNVYYIRLKKNSGPSTARNIGIANAIKNGSVLFQILDSDDQMYPTKVSELADIIFSNPQRIALAYADYNIINEDGVARYESKPVYDYLRFFNGDCHIHSGSLINGVAIQQFYPHFYPEHLRVTEDYYLWRKILRSQQWIAYHMAKPLTLVRSHSNDSTNSVTKAIWEDNYRRTMMET